MFAGPAYPPPPSDLADIARVEHTRKRRRLLYSCQKQDLDALMAAQLGHVRRAAWGEPDLTANPFLALWEQAARLYSEAPIIVPPPGGEVVVEAMERSGIWSMMQRVQRDTLGLREMFVHAALIDGELVFRPVFPDLVEVKVDVSRPSTPTHIIEHVYVDGAWRKESHTEPLPFVVYHAADTGWVFDPFALREVVEGSLNIGLLLTYYQHVVRNAAWSQRYAVGVEAAANAEQDASGRGGRSEIVTDPATLLLLRGSEEGGQPLIGQWSPPVDPEGLLRSIAMYERRILLLAGLNPPDVMRQEADIRSGYSLAVARESVREQQRLSEPMFRRGDLQLIALAARLLGAPETGYRIEYRGLPPSPQEMAAEREQVLALLGAGLLDRVAAYMRLNPGVSEDEARAKVNQIAITNRATQ
jgi:hypothetical protein